MDPACGQQRDCAPVAKNCKHALKCCCTVAVEGIGKFLIFARVFMFGLSLEKNDTSENVFVKVVIVGSSKDNNSRTESPGEGRSS
jgi:hypothetical protein